MSAPLYARYRRYADREASRFPRGSDMAKTATLWKRPDTRVYSLTERASHEAGWWSTEDPGELLRAMSMHYLPMPQVWIEIDWMAYNRGAGRLPLQSAQPGLVVGRNGIEVMTSENSPLRVGFMLYQPVKATNPRFQPTIMGHMFYLYGLGTCFIGPVMFAWHATEDLNLMRKTNETGQSYRVEEALRAAAGNDYLTRHEKNSPRLAKRLTERVFLTYMGPGRNTASFKEIDGTTRMAIAALTAALSARPPSYAPNPLRPSETRPAAPASERDRPVEVDLFIRERPRVMGGSIRASVGHLEAIKKGLHTVAAHFAYRSRSDGGDPTICTKSAQHDFEDIDGTKSQVCVFCGQKRWFKERHERGDEAYGIVPAKTYNVRVGSARMATQETTGK